jgi:hypothetical protein
MDFDYIIYHLMSSSLQFWKPGTLGPGSSLDRPSAEEDGLLPLAVPPQALSIQAQRDRLPIAKHSQQFLPFLWCQACDRCSLL